MRVHLIVQTVQWSTHAPLPHLKWQWTNLRYLGKKTIHRSVSLETTAQLLRNLSPYLTGKSCIIEAFKWRPDLNSLPAFTQKLSLNRSEWYWQKCFVVLDRCLNIQAVNSRLSRAIQFYLSKHFALFAGFVWKEAREGGFFYSGFLSVQGKYPFHM